jgi:hypothetical protein
MTESGSPVLPRSAGRPHRAASMSSSIMPYGGQEEHPYGARKGKGSERIDASGPGPYCGAETNLLTRD